MLYVPGAISVPTANVPSWSMVVFGPGAGDAAGDGDGESVGEGAGDAAGDGAGDAGVDGAVGDVESGSA